jgi:hypothetical protein
MERHHRGWLLSNGITDSDLQIFYNLSWGSMCHNKKKIVKIIFVITLVVFVVTFVICSLLKRGDGGEYYEFAKDGVYYFNPTTILDSMANNPGPYFYSEPQFKESLEIFQEYISEDEYLKIMNAFHQETWGENIQNYRIRGLGFTTDCINFNTGFNESFIRLYKVNNDKKQKFVHHILILFSEGKVLWSETVFSGELEYWNYFQLDDLNISAEESIKIAEDNGGKKFWVAMIDECVLQTILSTGSYYSGWDVNYSGEYEIIINPQNGKVLFSRSNKD